MLVYDVILERTETLSPDDLNIAASYHSLGSIHLELKEFGKALNFFLQELDIFRKHRLDFTPDLDANYYNLGAVYFSLDDFSEAEKFAELCLKVRERLFPHDLISRAKVLKQLAEIAEKREKWDKAERFYQKALQILPAEHEDRAAICQRLGATAKRNRNYPQAIEFYREAMKIEQANSGKYHANLYEIYRELNSLFKKTGREDEAKAYADKAAKVRSRR